MRFVCFLILFGFPSLAFAQSPSRFFTDLTGKFRIRATVVDLDETKVQLRKTDGTEVEVAIDKLSQSDQTFLREQYRRYKEMVGDFPIGTAVEIFSTGDWHSGKVLAVQPGKYFITFDKYSEAWNKWVTVDQLRLPLVDKEPIKRETELKVGEGSSSTMDEDAADSTEPLSRDVESGAPVAPHKSISVNDPTLPQLILESSAGAAFPYDHSWIQYRSFIGGIDGSEWKQPVVLGETRRLGEGSVALPFLNPHRPIDRLLSSHNNQRILIQQGSALTCVDLVGRRLEWVLPSFGEDDVLPLAISDSGSRLACRVYTPDSGRQGLRVYNINGLEASLFWQWRPDPVEWKVSPAHAATWLDDQRLAVLDSTSFSVWLPEQRMLREVTKTDASSLLVSSPSGNHLGLVFMNRLMMITAASPLQVNAFSMDLPAKTSSVSFQSGGDLAFASGGARAAVVDMRSGQITPVANELFKNSRAQWIDNRHMLIDGQWVAKTDQQKPIARFTAGLKNSNDRVWWVESLADKLVIVDPERGRLMLRNFSSLLPVESNGAERQPQYAVDHGAGVAISISGSAVGPFRTQVENRLRTIIDQNGWKFDAKSSLVLSGNIESITEPMEFSVTGLLAGKDAERITPTYYRFTVGLRRGSEVYHSAGYSTLATRITTLPAGKTLEQVVTERSRFRPELIESASIPAQIEAKKRGPDYLVIDVSMIESE